MISVKRDTWSLWKAHELEVANQASEARALAPKTHLDGFLDVVPLRCWKHSHDELVSVDGRQWAKTRCSAIPSALQSPTVRTLVHFFLRSLAVRSVGRGSADHIP